LKRKPHIDSSGGDEYVSRQAIADGNGLRIRNHVEIKSFFDIRKGGELETKGGIRRFEAVDVAKHPDADFFFLQTRAENIDGFSGLKNHVVTKYRGKDKVGFHVVPPSQASQLTKIISLSSGFEKDFSWDSVIFFAKVKPFLLEKSLE
jgi:hypothetical protein